MATCSIGDVIHIVNDCPNRLLRLVKQNGGCKDTNCVNISIVLFS